MTNEVIYFIPPMLGVILVGMGITYREYFIGNFGSLLLFLYGVAVLLVPITGISSLMNSIIGAICFGLGIYLFIRSNVENIEELLPI